MTVQLRRDYTGWTFLVLLVGILLATQLLGGDNSQKKEATDTVKIDLDLKNAITMKALNVKALTPLTDPIADKDLTDILVKVAPTRFTEPTSAEVYGVLCYELHKPVTSRDLGALKKDPKLGAEIYRVLWTSKFTPAEAAEIDPQIAGGSFVRQMVRTELYAKAGIPGPRQKLLNDLKSSHLVGIGLFLAIGLASFMLWVIFFSLKAQKAFPPLGLPNLPANLFEADRLASWTAALVLVYFVLLLVVQLVTPKVGRIGSIACTLVTVALFVPVVWAGPGKGKAAFANLGLSRNSPWARYIGFGVAAFLMEYPVSLVMAQVGDLVFPHQTSIHPAELSLIYSHDALMILALGLQASVQAPLFEELIFRGMMLPAIAKVTGSLIVSVGVTSFIFASLHPQGLGAVLGLATIAAASCALIYHTRSLAPSIVMHGLHNAFTLAFFLILS